MNVMMRVLMLEGLILCFLAKEQTNGVFQCHQYYQQKLQFKEIPAAIFFFFTLDYYV